MTEYVLTEDKVLMILALIGVFGILSVLGGIALSKWFKLNRDSSDNVEEPSSNLMRRQADLEAAGREKFKDDPVALDAYIRLGEGLK